jgi:hypothetical protein
MHDTIKQAVQIRDGGEQHQLEIEDQERSSDQLISRADYEAKDRARSREDVLSGAFNLDPDVAMDVQMIRWCLTRTKLRQPKAMQDKITGADRLSPKAQDRSKPRSVEHEVMNDIKLISVQFELVDDARSM